jgi:hypothetical protein
MQEPETLETFFARAFRLDIKASLQSTNTSMFSVRFNNCCDRLSISNIIFFIDDTELVILDANEFYIVIPHGEINYPIKCIPTHPDVNVSLIFEQQFTAIAKNIMEPKVRTF